MTKANEPQHNQAVIYCRVSSLKQVEEGHGLDSQEVRCREYAKRKDYDVLEVFADKGVSGGDLDRPEMRNMLSFLLSQPNKNTIVIIDDLNRFSRDVRVHWQLRDLVKNAGGILESPTMKFGDTSDDKLIENLLASVSQHQREKNGEQVVNRMRSRVLNGYWVFTAPKGYKYTDSKRQGKVLIRDEPMASILQEALEGYASGLFSTQSEVRHFLSSKPVTYPKNSRGEIHQSRVTELLTHPIYAGLVEADCWNVARRQGNHEGLISVETFQKIQDRLKQVAKAPARKDIAEDFPLRGFVSCADCGTPYRASWSQGKTKKYPYYLCQNKGCSSYGKSIRQADIEGQFEALLRDMRPSIQLFGIIKRMVFDAFQQRKNQATEITKSYHRELSKIEKTIEDLTDRLVETNSTATISAYERRIEKLENEKLVIAEKLEKGGQNLPEPSKVLELPLKFLSNPWKIWDSGNISLKKIVLRLVFAEPLTYHRIEGYRTPKTTLPFNMLGDFSMTNLEMVGLAGLEPATERL